MLSLQALLCTPEPDNPQDAVVAMYLNERAEFERTAKYWVQLHATSQSEEEDEEEKQETMDRNCDEINSRQTCQEVVIRWNHITLMHCLQLRPKANMMTTRN